MKPDTIYDVDNYISQFPERKPKISLYEYTDDDSYANRDLKKLLNMRLLRNYLIQVGIEEQGDINSINYHVQGIRKISSRFVFRARRIIQPARWYFRVNEELPKSIKFNNIYTEESFFSKDSIGHKKLKELIKLYSLKKVSEMYDLPIELIRNSIYKRFDKISQRQVFKAVPSEIVIYNLRNAIHPDYWFIYEEEIDNYKELQEDESNVLLYCDKIKTLILQKYGSLANKLINNLNKTKTYELLSKEKSLMKDHSPIDFFEMWENELIIGEPKNSKTY